MWTEWQEFHPAALGLQIVSHLVEATVTGSANLDLGQAARSTFDRCWYPTLKPTKPKGSER